MKKIFINILLILLICTCGSVNIFADNDEIFKIIILSDDKGGLYDTTTGDEVSSFEYSFDPDKSSVGYSIYNDVISITNYDETIIELVAKPKGDYSFYKWLDNGQFADPCSSCFISGGYITEFVLEAKFAKVSTFYWGLDVDLSKFNLDDYKTRYEMILSANKSDIANYDLKVNYETSGEWSEPYPLAGETNGVFYDEETAWRSCGSKINSVKVIGDIYVPSVAYWFAMFDFFDWETEESTPLTLDFSGLHGVIDASNMFFMSGSPSDITFIDFDTSEVVDMSYMFCDTGWTESIDLGDKFDTSSATSFANMFESCACEELDVSKFNTSNVTNMEHMFSCCSELEYLDLSNFDTSNVYTMEFMLDGCEKLKEIDVSSFDTSKVLFMGYLFEDCRELKSLDLSNFNTSKVRNMTYMFCGCSNLEEIDVSNFDVSNVEDISNAFNGCSSLKELDLTSFKFGPTKYVFCNYMLSDLYEIETIYASCDFDLRELDSYFFAFGGSCNPKLVGEQGTYMAKVDSEGNMIQDCGDPHCMFCNTENNDYLRAKLARIDRFDEDKPGYFTKGYHVVYKLDDGTVKKKVGKVGDQIELMKPSKDGYIFIGWSDGENIYTDYYTLQANETELTPIWKKNTIIETTIDDVIYNGDIQMPLPSALVNVDKSYFDVTYSVKNNNAESIKCKECGNYIAHIDLKEEAIDEGYCFIDNNGQKVYSYDIEFVIEKRSLTINIKSKTIHLKDKLPRLSFSSDNLVKGHKVNLELVCNGDTKTLGIYPITYEGSALIYDKDKNDVTNNYNITINDGELTVIKNSPSHDYHIPKTGIR